MKLLTLLHSFRSHKGPLPSPPFLFFTRLSLTFFPYPSFLLRPLLFSFPPPLTLIPPFSYLPLSTHHFHPAGLHTSQPLDGFKHLLSCPASSPPSAAWIFFCLLYLSIPADIKTIRPLVNCYPSPHVCSHLVHYSMPSPCSDMLIYSAPDLGSSSLEAI